VVSDDERKLDAGNCWRSGKISGNKTFGIRYSGKPLNDNPASESSGLKFIEYNDGYAFSKPVVATIPLNQNTRND